LRRFVYLVRMSAGRRGGGNVCRLLANHSTGKLIALICGLTYKLYSNNVALYAFKLRANKMIQDLNSPDQFVLSF